MEKRTLLAIVLMILVLMGYQYYLERTRPPRSPEPAKQTPPPSSSVPAARSFAGEDTLSRLSLPPASSREREIVVETDLLTVVVSNQGAKIKSWQLKKYLGPDGKPVEMVGIKGQSGPSFGLLSWSRNREACSGVYQFTPERLVLSPSQPQGRLLMRQLTSGGLELRKSFTFYHNDYRIDIETEVRNRGRQEQSIGFDLLWGPGIREHEGNEKGKTGLKPVLTLVNGQQVQDKWEKLEGAVEHEGTVSWTAVHDTYFCAALLPLQEGAFARVERFREMGPLVSLAYGERKLRPGESAVASYRGYIGPKEIDRLTRLGSGMRGIIDLGWFDFLARPALYFLKFIYRYLRNYGLAIIVLTLLVRIVLFPLTFKSFKSMQEMQKLQPRINALRERYKDDAKRMNQELMELYRKHNLNPLGGCLPMLLQIPIFIALYNALINSVELWRAPFVWWIKDLSAKDPYYVLPILMGASWVIQQAITPSVGDPRQAKMMLVMPVIFTFMFLNFPSGLVLYFLVSNLLGIAQQYLMNRQLKVSSRAGGEG